jgi:hypothetical protein
MKARRHNTRLAQWGLTSLNESFCFYCTFVLADSLVLRNPLLRKAAKRQVVKKLTFASFLG